MATRKRISYSVDHAPTHATLAVEPAARAARNVEHCPACGLGIDGSKPPEHESPDEPCPYCGPGGKFSLGPHWVVVEYEGRVVRGEQAIATFLASLGRKANAARATAADGFWTYASKIFGASGADAYIDPVTGDMIVAGMKIPKEK